MELNKEEKLKVRITFKSGRYMDVESENHIKGQFKQWLVETMTIGGEGKKFPDWQTLNNGLINFNEVEQMNVIN